MAKVTRNTIQSEAKVSGNEGILVPLWFAGDYLESAYAIWVCCLLFF